MREIKFRFYSILSREYLHDFSADRDGITVTGEHACYGWLTYDFKVEKYLCEDEVIVEQFTGLHDKNGKEIYEGDVLQNNAGGHAPVIYRCGGFFVELVDCEEFGTMYVPLNEAILLANLVGNIHENPELLEATC